MNFEIMTNNGVTLVLDNVKNGNVDAKIKYLGNKVDIVDIKFYLDHQAYGIYGHSMNSFATNPIDLYSALMQSKYDPKIVSGAILVSKYDPEIPEGAMT